MLEECNVHGIFLYVMRLEDGSDMSLNGVTLKQAVSSCFTVPLCVVPETGVQKVGVFRSIVGRLGQTNVHHCASAL